MVDSPVPVCPLLSTRSDITELCLGDQCAWYVTPVRKCALYVMGHKGAVDLQHLQSQMGPMPTPKAADDHH